MNKRDRELGMGRDITRRDFVGGVATLVSGSALLGVSGCKPQALTSQPTPPGPVGYRRTNTPDVSSYPPLRTDLRGSHEGSYNVAHALAREGKTDWGQARRIDDTQYDLVIVGAGLSGLASAFYYQEQHPDARILILDNHDDFGGHARRNEFQVGDQTIVGYGGSQSLEGPNGYPEMVKDLIRKVGIDTSRFDSEYYDHDFYRRHDLGMTLFFDEKTYGRNETVRISTFDPSYFLPAQVGEIPFETSLAQMPLSTEAKQELRRLHTVTEDMLPDQSIFSEPGYLDQITYLELITKHFGITNEQVIGLYHHMPAAYFARGIDQLSALDAIGFGLPGLNMTGLGAFEGLLRYGLQLSAEPYTYHFPDGNAGLARMIVRRLIPGVASGNTMEDVVPAHFDYTKLDLEDSATRIRLNSTVINVEHNGPENAATSVNVTYVRDGIVERVQARQCILACYGQVIPHLCPTMPDRQRKALSEQTKAPLVYTNVLLRNWQALKKQHVAIAHCPGSWHHLALTDFPVSMGDYKFANEEDHPIVMSLHAAPLVPGLPLREQYKSARAMLLGTSFEDIEREVRTQIAGMLAPGGLDPAEDILGITVNRHAHGYARNARHFKDKHYDEAPHVVGRQPFGRIRVANSDAGGGANVPTAIREGWRAVQEL